MKLAFEGDAVPGGVGPEEVTVVSLGIEEPVEEPDGVVESERQVHVGLEEMRVCVGLFGVLAGISVGVGFEEIERKLEIGKSVEESVGVVEVQVGLEEMRVCVGLFGVFEIERKLETGKSVDESVGVIEEVQVGLKEMCVCVGLTELSVGMSVGVGSKGSEWKLEVGESVEESVGVVHFEEEVYVGFGEVSVCPGLDEVSAEIAVGFGFVGFEGLMVIDGPVEESVEVVEFEEQVHVGLEEMYVCVGLTEGCVGVVSKGSEGKAEIEESVEESDGVVQEVQGGPIEVRVCGGLVEISAGISVEAGYEGSERKLEIGESAQETVGVAYFEEEIYVGIGKVSVGVCLGLDEVSAEIAVGFVHVGLMVIDGSVEESVEVVEFEEQVHVGLEEMCACVDVIEGSAGFSVGVGSKDFEREMVIENSVEKTVGEVEEVQVGLEVVAAEIPVGLSAGKAEFEGEVEANVELSVAEFGELEVPELERASSLLRIAFLSAQLVEASGHPFSAPPEFCRVTSKAWNLAN